MKQGKHLYTTDNKLPTKVKLTDKNIQRRWRQKLWQHWAKVKNPYINNIMKSISINSVINVPAWQWASTSFNKAVSMWNVTLITITVFSHHKQSTKQSMFHVMMHDSLTTHHRIMLLIHESQSLIFHQQSWFCSPFKKFSRRKLFSIVFISYKGTSLVCRSLRKNTGTLPSTQKQQQQQSEMSKRINHPNSPSYNKIPCSHMPLAKNLISQKFLLL